MKIGILTHHYVKNYGAFLQMKGMYETLQRLYPEAEVTVINYVNQKHWRRNIIHILHFRPGVDTLSTYVEKIRQLRTFIKYERSIPRTRSVKTAKEIIDLKLDLIVLGSDEIWNLCGSGYHPLKFGTGLENQRTIAYAPSVGAVTEETAVPEDVFSGLKHLDRISGRDVESLKFVERACGRKAEKMLDPTFLYNFDMDIESEKKNNNRFEKTYGKYGLYFIDYKHCYRTGIHKIRFKWRAGREPGYIFKSNGECCCI